MLQCQRTSGIGNGDPRSVIAKRQGDKREKFLGKCIGLFKSAI